MIDFTRYLDDLEARIDPEEEARIHGAWVDFLDGRQAAHLPPGEAFRAPRRRPKPPRIDWPEIHVNDALADIDTMVLHQLCGVSQALEHGSNAILNVRANYGVSIMTSQLGCEVVVMAREQGNLPTVRALEPQRSGSAADTARVDAARAERAAPVGSSASAANRELAIRQALDRGVPDLRAGQGADVFDCGDRFAAVLAIRSVLEQWIMMYHPDTQGPIDNAELAWGSDIFLAFYDTPELVHEFLDLMVQHYTAFLGAWFKAHPTKTEYTAHWGNLIKGRVMLRDDSLMNLSPEIYDEFIFQRERTSLNALGGGVIHFCGRGSHVIDRFAGIESLTGINLSQPHLNDMDAIFAATVDKGLSIVGFDAEAARSAAARGTNLRGRVHCW